MPRILKTSAEAIDFCNKHRGRRVRDRNGLQGWINPQGQILVASGVLSGGQFFVCTAAPFSAEDEPGNEELPESVKEAMSREVFNPDGPHAHILTALWREVSKLVREGGK
ncbi:hypothetical protein EP7_004299 [Isosphaeraceae bacterium EP7]